jgi:hypothetical protein
VTPEEARAALDRLRGAALLAQADTDSVVDIVLRFSELCQHIGSQFQAIDLNPLVVRRAGEGAYVVDCLFERMGQPHGTA